MKPLPNIFFAALLIIFSVQVHAQEKLPQYMKDANESLARKDYKATQAALQKALKEVNVIMGKELLAALPMELNGMKSDPENDTNGGDMPVMTNTGVTVSRDYIGEDDKSATLTIMSNSPAAMSINMIIGNPSLIEQNEGGAKIVSVGNFSGLLSWDTENKSGDLQIPVGSSVIALNADGFDNEDAFIALASRLDIAAIKKLLGEK